MASVTNSVSSKYRRLGLEEDEAPEHDNTAAQQLIREMVKKQTNTSTSLAQQMSLQQHFTGPSELVDLTSLPHGECSLQQFSQISSEVEVANKLRSRGLGEADIKLALELRSHGETYVREKYRLSVLGERLGHVKTALAHGECSLQQFSQISSEVEVANKLRSRGLGETDIKLALELRSQGETYVREKYRLSVLGERLGHVKTALASEQLEEVPPQQGRTNYPADHPINKLRDIEHQLFAHLEVKKPPRSRRKRGSRKPKSPQRLLDLEPSSAPSADEPERRSDGSSVASSQWDSREVPHYSPATRPAAEKTYTCSAQTWYTLENNQTKFLGSKRPRDQPPQPAVTSPGLHGKAFVSPASDHTLVSLEEIQCQRLSLEEIKRDPKFANYQQGTPSKTLYVKNLSSNMREADLVSVFGHFEQRDLSKPRLVYRLMAGKMRGQAFVTFCDADAALLALQAVNGFKLKGKPMIVQFGRHNS